MHFFYYSFDGGLNKAVKIAKADPRFDDTAWAIENILLFTTFNNVQADVVRQT